MKILIVDDEDDLLFSLKEGLEDINNEYRVISAKNGEECINILFYDIPDLILLDLMMPKMNGWQVLEKILENIRWRDIPIFIITAVSNPKLKKMTDSLEIVHIEKPFTIEVIHNNIIEYFHEN
jgi:CheY-like chemotaxis protein